MATATPQLPAESVSVLTWPTPAEARTDFVTFGAVDLDVTDLSRSTAFWRDVIGLVERPTDTDAVELGTADKTLIALHGGAKAGFQQGYSGIYHPAVHATSAADFARIVLRLIRAGWRIAPTDHVFSQAIYLLDPDGITVEITLETPERLHEIHVGDRTLAVIDSNGDIRSGRDRLDLEAVLSELSGSDDAALAPETRIGHVHLYGSDIVASHAFYSNLGFTEGIYAPHFGSVDFGAGGLFNHRLAVNTWQGAGAPPAPAGTARMRHFTMEFAEAQTLDHALGTAGDVTESVNGYGVTDPSGNHIRLTTKKD